MPNRQEHCALSVAALAAMALAPAVGYAKQAPALVSARHDVQNDVKLEEVVVTAERSSASGNGRSAFWTCPASVDG